jgi:hypothetical protein
MDNDQLKQQLLELIQVERTAFKKVLDEFYRKPSPTEAEFLVVNDLLIASLQRVFKVYHDKHGDESRFLQNTMKPLQKALDEALAVKRAAEGERPGAANDEAAQAEVEIPADREVVYITLYQSSGEDLAAWVRQIKSINNLLQTRPIYSDELDAKKATRGKMSLHAEAYLAVAIKKTSIIKTEAALRRRDRQDRQLVTLIEGSVDDPHYILRLVVGERQYRWNDEQLTPIIEQRNRFF